jgi:hypothetical protein
MDAGGTWGRCFFNDAGSVPLLSVPVLRRLPLALIALLTLLALPSVAAAKSGIALSHAVTVRPFPDMAAPARPLPLLLGCPAFYPLIATLRAPADPAAAARAPSPVLWYRIRLSNGHAVWILPRFARETTYKNPRCGQLAGDLAPPISGPERGRFIRLLGKLRLLSDSLHRPLYVNGGYRTRAEQSALYHQFLAGSGAPANPPGHSVHEAGGAADVIFGRHKQLSSLRLSVGLDPRARREMRRLGLCRPHPAEPWHVEHC